MYFYLRQRSWTEGMYSPLFDCVFVCLLAELLEKVWTDLDEMLWGCSPPHRNHGYLQVTHLSMQEHFCHASFHAYWYTNVMQSSRLFRVSLFLKNGSILMIWGCFSIVSNVIRSNYCCRRHTMHGNTVFSTDSILPTPQQSGCLLACNAKWTGDIDSIIWFWIRIRDPEHEFH